VGWVGGCSAIRGGGVYFIYFFLLYSRPTFDTPVNSPPTANALHVLLMYVNPGLLGAREVGWAFARCSTRGGGVLTFVLCLQVHCSCNIEVNTPPTHEAMQNLHSSVNRPLWSGKGGGDHARPEGVVCSLWSLASGSQYSCEHTTHSGSQYSCEHTTHSGSQYSCEHTTHSGLPCMISLECCNPCV
jgi:hypothetical protein